MRAAAKKPARHPRPKRKKPKRRRVKANGVEPIRRPSNTTADGPRQRAIAALEKNPGLSLTAVAGIAKGNRSTVVNARGELAGEACKEARKDARKPGPKPKPTERRQRAERFLKDALAHGPKQVSEVEEAAEKAHVDPHSLEQARAELGVIVSRSNAGGVQAVQWALPR